MEDKKKYILEGIFTEFATVSYPGRIYGKYIWDKKNQCWKSNPEFETFFEDILKQEGLKG